MIRTLKYVKRVIHRVWVWQTDTFSKMIFEFLTSLISHLFVLKTCILFWNVDEQTKYRDIRTANRFEKKKITIEFNLGGVAFFSRFTYTIFFGINSYTVAEFAMWFAQTHAQIYISRISERQRQIPYLLVGYSENYQIIQWIQMSIILN